MKIFGLDFTSAPSRKKPITFAECRLEQDSLIVEKLGCLPSFDEFERFLNQQGPWLAGMDFPFGQPRTLIENIGWPQTWEGYVEVVSKMTKVQFIEALTEYCRDREKGDKHHLRQTDQLAHSRSPMMLHRVPVGKMFFEGAPRLLRAGVRIEPCFPKVDSRVVMETYPALVARRWIGSRTYKTDTPKGQTQAMQLARAEILSGLRSADAKTGFGFEIHSDKAHEEMFIRDGSADQLDAFLCAIQAGWAYSQREYHFGIPTHCDSLEGWIVDPMLARGEVK